MEPALDRGVHTKKTPCPLWLLLVVALAPLSSGCTRAHARAIERPPLDVPSPPPRVVEPPVEAEAPPLVTLPEDLPQAPVRPRPSAPRRVDPPRTEPPRVEAPAAPEPRKAAEEPARATTLQTTPAAEEEEIERAIHATLARAASALGRVDARTLNAAARAQYDTARRFVQQAQDAVRDRNLVFAKNLAEKAEGLAAQLAGR